MLEWPERAQADKAIRAWAEQRVNEHPELPRLAYFGSYARGDWGVGSDLDLVAVVRDAAEPFERRALSWDLDSPTVWVYFLMTRSVDTSGDDSSTLV